MKFAIERFRHGVWHRIEGVWDTRKTADRHVKRLTAGGISGPYRIVEHEIVRPPPEAPTPPLGPRTIARVVAHSGDPRRFLI